MDVLSSGDRGGEEHGLLFWGCASYFFAFRAPKDAYAQGVVLSEAKSLRSNLDIDTRIPIVSLLQVATQTQPIAHDFPVNPPPWAHTGHPGFFSPAGEKNVRA